MDGRVCMRYKEAEGETRPDDCFCILIPGVLLAKDGCAAWQGAPSASFAAQTALIVENLHRNSSLLSKR